MRAQLGRDGWYLCDSFDRPSPECREFKGSETLARQWVGQFRGDFFAMSALRRLWTKTSQGPVSDDELLRQVSWELSTGRLKARQPIVRPVTGGGGGGSESTQVKPFPLELKHHPAPPARPPTSKRHWVGVRVEDEDCVAVRDIRVSFALTDGSNYALNLADGTYRTEQVLPSGLCTFGLPDVQDVEWWPKGEPIPAARGDIGAAGGEGRCVASIAAEYGFRNYHSFWDHSRNNPIRDKKRNPHHLGGDEIIYLSNQKTKKVSSPVDQVWTLVVKKKRPVQLRIKVVDREGKGIAGVEWKLMSPISEHGTTGPDGLIQIDDLPPSATEGLMEVTMPAGPKTDEPPPVPQADPDGYPPPIRHADFADFEESPAAERSGRSTAVWQLKIGSLAQFDTAEGVRGRLGNLGFHCAPDSDDETTARAVRAYQRCHKQEMDGSGELEHIQNDLLALHDKP